jgi:hypothetical protein
MPWLLPGYVVPVALSGWPFGRPTPSSTFSRGRDFQVLREQAKCLHSTLHPCVLMLLLHTHDCDPFIYTCVSEFSKRQPLKGITFPPFTSICKIKTCRFTVEGSSLVNLHRTLSFSKNLLYVVYTMNPSTYSDFTSITTAFDDTPNTWMGRLLVTEIYWFFALFVWIIVTNLDLIEEWLRPSLLVQPISEYIKGQRRIRRLHEISILLLSFGALLFLVQRQGDSALSPSKSSGLHPCSMVQGEPFWRCVRARSMTFPERARVVQHAQSIVDDEGNKHADASKHRENFSTTFYPLLSDHLDMYLSDSRDYR